MGFSQFARLPGELRLMDKILSWVQYPIKRWELWHISYYYYEHDADFSLCIVFSPNLNPKPETQGDLFTLAVSSALLVRSIKIRILYPQVSWFSFITSLAGFVLSFIIITLVGGRVVFGTANPKTSKHESNATRQTLNPKL